MSRKDYNKAYYKKRGTFFPEIKGFFFSLLIKILLRPKTLLDVGCAEGKMIKWGLKLKVDTYGVDLSSKGFEKAKEVIRSRCQAGNLLELPFKNNQFEVTTCLALMEHIEARKTSKALKELLRVSEKYVLLQICVKDNPIEGKHYQLDPTHVNVKKSDWWVKKFQKMKIKVALALPKFGLFLLRC